MKDILTLSSSQILAISELEPERLFGRPHLVAERYKDLVKRWHPDIPSSGDGEVFKHINVLHAKAKDIIEKDLVWHAPGEMMFSVGGTAYVLRFFKSFEFELGRAYLSETTLTYVVRKEFADLVENASAAIAALRFPDNETKDVMMRYMPVIKGRYETHDSVVLMLEKPADLIRMRDLRDHCGGKIDPKHVAWMVSRMLNHTSYFEWAQISHNDLSLDTLFVCPEHHTVCVLGGWWYASAIGKKLKALPQRTITNAPSVLINSKLAMLETDPELVRLTGRELLGNANGVHLMLDNSIPRGLVSWLRLPGRGHAIKDYAEWRDKILPDSFGPRKFVKMTITTEDVYPSES